MGWFASRPPLDLKLLSDAARFLNTTLAGKDATYATVEFSIRVKLLADGADPDMTERVIRRIMDGR